MKPRTVLLLIAAIPIAAYGLAYGSVWFQTRASLNRFAEAIAPIADFGYGSLSIGPSGTIEVSDLTFAPREIQDVIRIDRVAVRTPGIDFILHGSQSLREGKIPQRLGLEFTGIRVAADGPIWEQIGKLNGKDRPPPDNGLACGIAGIVLMEGILKSLMPAQIVTSVEFLMQTGELPGTASIHLRWRQQGYGALAVELRYRQVGEMLASLRNTAALETVVVTASLDPLYAGQAQQICADNSRLPIDRFVSTLLAENDRAYLQDIGLIPGFGIRTLLQGFIGAEEVTVQITLPDGFELASVKKYRAEDVPQLLGMQVALNGSAITDLGFTTTPGPPPKPVPSDAQKSHQPGDDLPAELRFTDLPRCLGCPVLITLRDGHERRGIIDSTENGSLYLKQVRQDGTITMEISAKDVSKIRRLNARP
ncbi:hypothetical protein [uncultured Thiodictyon sp.]|uniref:hypothetical protein n=1 Tax=uncultured Thiodictyon sp. TaxID=1846217 RepID=UPI0025F789F5|nr:hypothetical protein [uncultured Thiodictyon sp.]